MLSKNGLLPTVQVCISFALHQGLVVIPKSSNLERIKENYSAIHLQLDSEDLRQLVSLERGYRMVQPAWLVKTGETIDQFWDIESDSQLAVDKFNSQKEFYL